MLKPQRLPSLSSLLVAAVLAWCTVLPIAAAQRSTLEPSDPDRARTARQQGAQSGSEMQTYHAPTGTRAMQRGQLVAPGSRPSRATQGGTPGVERSRQRPVAKPEPVVDPLEASIRGAKRPKIVGLAENPDRKIAQVLSEPRKNTRRTATGGDAALMKTITKKADLPVEPAMQGMNGGKRRRGNSEQF